MNHTLEMQRELAMARAAGRAGDLAAAQRRAHAVLELSRQHNARDVEADALVVLGGVAFECGQLTLAEDLFLAAQRRARDLGNDGLAARAGNNIANICHLRGDSQTARELYRHSLEAYRGLGDRRGQAETLHNLATLLRMDGNVTEASRVTGEALEHAMAVGDTDLLAYVVTSEAENAIEAGSPEYAEGLLVQAGDLTRYTSDARHKAEVSRLRAECLARRGDLEIAIAVADDAATAARDHQSPRIEAECHATAARLLEDAGRQDEADARYHVAAQLYEAMGASGRLPVHRRGPPA
jgi:tetratricopeptide (TPR) repeat protein